MNFVSLFSGCGGFDLGFLQAGFKCISAFDNDSTAVDVYRKNLDSSINLHDLTSGCISYGPYNKVDIVIAGPPCQGFSTAGKRLLDDPRNSLLIAAGSRAVALKPKMFIAENVRGVVSGEHKEYWEKLKALLNNSGYKTTEKLIDVSKIGVPQIRKRMVLVAWNTGRDFDFTLNQKPEVSLGQALAGLENVRNHNPTYLKVGSPDYLIAKKILCGQKLSDVRGGKNSIHSWDIPEVFGSVTETEKQVLEQIISLRRRIRSRDKGDADPLSMETLTEYISPRITTQIDSLLDKGYLKFKNGLIDLSRGFNGKYRRLAPDKPSLTVDTRFGEPQYFLHPKEDRGFTVREAARIQGFPDDFVFEDNNKKQYTLIGNAVPPPLSNILAGIAKEHLS